MAYRNPKTGLTRGYKQKKLTSEAYGATGGFARNNIANRAIVGHKGKSSLTGKGHNFPSSHQTPCYETFLSWEKGPCDIVEGKGRLMLLISGKMLPLRENLHSLPLEDQFASKDV